MPPSLEKPKRKKKDQKQKQKQKQQQTVIVNINKQKRGEKSGQRNNGIEKPKEKEQPKTYNSFSFSAPQAQNPIGEYLKSYSKDLFTKIEQSIKSRDPVINSADEAIKPIITVKSAERIPTPLELITPPKPFGKTLQENYLRNQEQIPLTIGDSTVLDNVTTLDTPVELSSPLPAPEPSPEEITKDTVEAIKKVEESPDLFTVLNSPVKADELPSQVQRQLIGARQLGRPPGTTKEVMAERALMGQEDTFKKIKRPVGRPPGTNQPILDARNLQAMYEDPENQPRIIPVKPLPPRSRILSAPNISGRLASFNSPPRQDSSDLNLPARVYRRKSENSPFTVFEEPPKSTPIRRSSINIGSRLGSPL